jgi:hypothetical protein
MDYAHDHSLRNPIMYPERGDEFLLGGRHIRIVKATSEVVEYIDVDVERVGPPFSQRRAIWHREVARRIEFLDEDARSRRAQMKPYLAVADSTRGAGTT